MDLSGLRALGRHVAEQEDAIVGDEIDEALRAKLAAHAAGRSTRRERRGAFRPAWALAAAAVALAAGLFLVLAREGGEAGALAFTVGEPPRPGVVGDLVSAPKASGVSLRFSEGSRVLLHAESQARVASMAPSGAELVLDGGKARVDVVPRAGNDWRVRAGRVVVYVKGTQFDVAWDRQTEEFRLELFEGRVVVAGCGFGSGRSVVAGQRALASCRSGELAVEALAAPAIREAVPPAAEPPPSADPAQAGRPLTRPSDASQEPASSVAPERRSANAAPAVAGGAGEDWVSLARAGRYKNAYALLLGAGLAAERQRRGADELLLLAETARSAGHPEEARLAYAAVRERFAGGSAAAQAAFELGRLDARAGRAAQAEPWFEIYLAERPGGPLASAALGRLLETQAARGEARASAEKYLERYPTGPHADLARKVLDNETR